MIKKKIFAHLLKEVIMPGYCLGCGACVATCPYDCLEIKNEKPALKKRCELCGICYFQCPLVYDQKEVEKIVFGKNAPPEEPAGIFANVFSVRAKDEVIRNRAQDGGAVTALLVSLLEMNYIDGAIVMGVGNGPWKPLAKVAEDKAEIINCAGSKYSLTPIFLGLKDATDMYSKERLAIVGLPCQMKAMRQMRFAPFKNDRISDSIKLTIGLFCMENYSYEDFFTNFIEKKLGIDPNEITKIDIKKGILIVSVKDKPSREVSIKELDPFVTQSCRICPDFCAELADISVGSTGSPPGYSTVVLRTPIGIEAFEKVRNANVLEIQPIDAVKPGMKSVRRLSERKKSSSQKELEQLRLSGKPLPPRSVSPSPEI
jgi:coenzyme F420 hydrogenase subunit beta